MGYDKTQAGLTMEQLYWLQTLSNLYFYEFKTDENQN